MRRIAVLMAIVFVDMLGFAIVFPLLPFYALRLEAEPWMVGWMIAVYSCAQLAAAPLWGRVSDRYGRRPALLIGLGASALAFLVFAFATSIWMLFLSRLVQGAGGGTTGVAQAYVGDAIGTKDRARALGWLSAASSAGVMLGPVTGSLATTLGAEAPGLAAAALCLINMLVAACWLPEPTRASGAPGHSGATPAAPASAPAPPPPPLRSIRGQIGDILRSPRGVVARLIWIYTVGMLGFMSMTSVLALYLDTRFGITDRTIGFFFLYVGAIGLLMRGLLLGWLVDRFGELRVMRLGAVLLAIGLALIPLPGVLAGMAVVMAFVPVGTACLFPATTALITQRVSRAELGQTLGVQQAFGGVARILAPIWATAAFQGLGLGVPFWAAAVVVALVGLLAFRFPDGALGEERKGT